MQNSYIYVYHLENISRLRQLLQMLLRSLRQYPARSYIIQDSCYNRNNNDEVITETYKYIRARGYNCKIQVHKSMRSASCNRFGVVELAKVHESICLCLQQTNAATIRKNSNYLTQTFVFVLHTRTPQRLNPRIEPTQQGYGFLGKRSLLIIYSCIEPHLRQNILLICLLHNLTVEMRR